MTDPDHKQAAAHHTDKAFTDLQARFALVGHTFNCTSHKDGTTGFYATRWGLVRHLRDFDEARDFLRQIGGEA